MQPGYNGSYGAAGYPYADLEGYTDTKPVFVRQIDKGVMTVASVFLPWALFTATLHVCCFTIHFETPNVAIAICGTFLFLVLLVGVAAFRILKNRAVTGQDPAWPIFMFGTGVLAWIMAVLIGQAVYANYMRPYFDIQALSHYTAVDPAARTGQQLMDAGRIDFAENSTLDISKSMGFKNFDTYCVAPVSQKGGKNSTFKKAETYDFWAVGLNCCSPHGSDFHCGDFGKDNVKSGVRLVHGAVHDEQTGFFSRAELTGFFRLAVEEATAKYDIKADHPIFLTWTKAPGIEINAYADNGMRCFLMSALGHLSFQLFLVIAMTVVLALPRGS